MNETKEVLKNKKYENLIEENSRLKMLIKHIFNAEMMECSPECCPLCYEGSSCDGSADYCKKYHLEDMSRILNNLQKQEETSLE